MEGPRDSITQRTSDFQRLDEILISHIPVLLLHTTLASVSGPPNLLVLTYFAFYCLFRTFDFGLMAENLFGFD